MASNERNNRKCYYCDQDHYSDGCQQFADLNTRSSIEELFGSIEELSVASTKVKKSNLVAVCKQAVMQTAMVNLVCLMNHEKSCKTKTRLLLNCGA